MSIEEGTGNEIRCRRNANATMDTRSYEAGQHMKGKNKRDIESGINHNKNLGNEAEVVCDEKRGALHRKEDDGNESTKEKEERKT